MLSQLLFSYNVSPWKSPHRPPQIAKTSLLCMGSNGLQIRAYPLIKHVTDQPDGTAEQLSYESFKKRGGVQSRRETSERTRGIKTSYETATTCWPEANLFPNTFTHILLIAFKRSHNCFPFSYVAYAPKRKHPGSVPGRSSWATQATLLENVKTCRQAWSLSPCR